MKRFSTAIALCLLSVSLAFGYCFTAWTTMTGAKTLAANPFFYLEPLGSGMDLNADIVGGYGFTDNMDLFVNLASLNLKSDPGAYGGSWLMPRYQIKENHILALQLGADANVEYFDIIPQYHYVMDRETWTLEVNALASFNTFDMGTPTFSACLAPVYKLSQDRFYPFLEVNPSYALGDNGGFDFNVAPGFWVGVPETPHQFAVSVPLYGIKDSDISAGIYVWYWYSLSLGKE
ncbi:MAG: hypothetical protein V1913_09860 [Fibrobacterota bacterium]